MPNINAPPSLDFLPRFFRDSTTPIFVDYKEAERACEVLAFLILNEIPRNELKSFVFLPIPRSGYIVLGMLSYFLGLHEDQLQHREIEGKPLCFVDDCALTGAKFRRYLASSACETIVFAHLYSHPALREAILANESRVHYCIAAHDLHDYKNGIFDSSDEYVRRHKEHDRQFSKNRYWVGKLPLICFPWSEPDIVCFGSDGSPTEFNWRYSPPHLCLKNRELLGIPLCQIEHPRWQVPSGVIIGLFKDNLWLYDKTSKEVFFLDHVGLEFWRCLLSFGASDEGIRYLQSFFDVDEKRLLDDLFDFASQLEIRGFLRKCGSTC